MTVMQRIPQEDNPVLVEVKHLKMHFPVTSGVLLQRTVGTLRQSMMLALSSSAERR